VSRGRQRVRGVLGGEGDGRPLVLLPAEVAAVLGGRARIPVAGTVDGVPFRGSTMPMGDGRHCIGFRKELRDAAGVEVGDEVELVIGRDDEPRTVVVPDDLASALAAEPGLREAFDAMSSTHRRERVEGIEGARRPETRARRIAAAVAAARLSGR
jgi:bifunctional DNA-binding transcriptional regulator/antitoxin component of YhaV-PrlF toxin-antitoxin module